MHAMPLEFLIFDVRLPCTARHDLNVRIFNPGLFPAYFILYSALIVLRIKMHGHFTYSRQRYTRSMVQVYINRKSHVMC